MKRSRTTDWLLGTCLVTALGVAFVPAKIFAASPAPDVKIEMAGVAPRQVEETTATTIQRDYTNAWKSLNQALDENRPDLLDANFVGAAHDQFAQAIKDQQQNGVSRRIVDHGHQAQVMFYSLDGSAMQIRDTVNVEIQYREGSKVLSSQQQTLHYIALLTPAENSWKVRVLEAVPNF